MGTARADLLSSCADAVEDFRPLYETSGPPFSLRGVLDHFRVGEVRERLLDRDARLIVEGDRAIIEVNSIFPRVRRRLSVAHEIAHMIVNECDGRSKLSVSHGDPAEESLCNRLAGELLAPDWALRNYLEREPDHLIPQGNRSIRCSTVLTAASVFGVSVDVISRRIFQDLGLAPSKVAIIWRERENSRTQSSERALRICSVWRSLASQFIPLNKTAPAHSVIAKAFRNGGFLFQEEELTIGGLVGRFGVEAAGFKCLALPGSQTSSIAVLSLLEQVSAP